MKRYINCIYSLLALVCVGFVLSACSDQDYTEFDKGRDQLTLTANQALSTLEETSHSSDAVTLNWSTGNNYGSGNRISYRLELAKAGTNFAQPYVAVDEQTQTYTWSANVENLNNIEEVT